MNNINECLKYITNITTVVWSLFVCVQNAESKEREQILLELQQIRKEEEERCVFFKEAKLL